MQEDDDAFIVKHDKEGRDPRANTLVSYSFPGGRAFLLIKGPLDTEQRQTLEFNMGRIQEEQGKTRGGAA